MSRKRGREEEVSGSTESENSDASRNEYELLREARMESNNTFLQPALAAANELYSSIGEKKKRAPPKRKHDKGGPKRRSQRLGRLNVEVSKKISSPSIEEIFVDDANDNTGGPSERRRRAPTVGELSSEALNNAKKLRYVHKGFSCENAIPKVNSSGADRVCNDFPVPRVVPGFRGDARKPTVEQSRDTTPFSSTNPLQAPPGWTLVPIPPGQTASQFYNASGVLAEPPICPGGNIPPLESHPNVAERQATEVQTNERSSVSRSSSIKDESLRRRQRRQNKREADEVARRRESSGMKPFAVQVEPSGIIDSSCEGHLQWQEFVRNLTPRMLDMSVIRYEDQNDNSKTKLRDALRNKFEFTGNEITDDSIDKMIKTWIREDRERMKRLHGSQLKAPNKYSEKEWVAVRKYWNLELPQVKIGIRKMAEMRKKVQSNPRVGRHGYAGKAATVRDLDRGTGVCEAADKLKHSFENPSILVIYLFLFGIYRLSAYVFSRFNALCSSSWE
ncbi:hypothetical protein M758_UG256800 [Ceratodon purpureus]|nr:hypothetical protein M758_UG256800 [Ceratodon purpureus]